MPVTSADARTARSDRMADIAEREARWWMVLARWTYAQAYQPGGVPLVFGRAVLRTIDDRTDRARMLRHAAADFRARAAGRPVCPVLGCGCGGSGECGVAA
jgi:hypothetical protein